MADLTKVAGRLCFKTVLGSDNDEVIIGKESDVLSFTPQITFTKWNKENSLTIIPDKTWFTSLTPTLSADTKELSFGDSKIGFYYAPQTDNSIFKFGIIWKEFPQSNSWSVDLSGYEDLDFIYQPPLSKDNPTGRKLAQDGVTYFDVRPENVVGSYAIYHKSKANHETGGTNYSTGKLFHWYRPKFIDALGNWTWGTLVYENGKMTETCPQEFLDTATYPVRSNVDVGYQSAGATSDWLGSSQTFYFRVSGTPASNGTLNYIHFWYHSNAEDQVRYALYTGDTYPLSRVVADASRFVCADTDNVNTDKANTTDYNTAITASTQYWVAAGDGFSGSIYCHWDSGSDTIGCNNENLPASPHAAPFDYPFADSLGSAYFSYTAGGGGTTANVVASLLTMTAGIVSPTYKYDYKFTPSLLNITASVVDPTKKFDYKLTPAIQSLTAGIVAPTVRCGCSITPDLLTLTASLFDPTFKFDKSFTPEMVSLTAGVLSPNVNYDYVYTVSSLALTSILLDPTVTGTEVTVITPDMLTLTSAVLDPSIFNDYVMRIAEALNITASVQDPTVKNDYVIALSPLSLASQVFGPDIKYDYKIELNALSLGINLFEVEPTMLAHVYTLTGKSRMELEMMKFIPASNMVSVLIVLTS